MYVSNFLIDYIDIPLLTESVAPNIMNMHFHRSFGFYLHHGFIRQMSRQLLY